VPVSLTQRRALLTAAPLVRVPEPHPAALVTLRRWLGSWRGIGAIAEGMHRQGFDISLTQYDDRGWRATFYVSGMEHSATGATGSAWEPTAARAVQRAAWEALTNAGAA